jgi:hypothetical protein
VCCTYSTQNIADLSTDIIAVIVKTPEFALTPKASIKQIVEMVSFHLSFFLILTTLPVQIEEKLEASCHSTVAYVQP